MHPKCITNTGYPSHMQRTSHSVQPKKNQVFIKIEYQVKFTLVYSDMPHASSIFTASFSGSIFSRFNPSAVNFHGPGSYELRVSRALSCMTVAAMNSSQSSYCSPEIFTLWRWSEPHQVSVLGNSEAPLTRRIYTYLDFSRVLESTDAITDTKHSFTCVFLLFFRFIAL